jgi:hypothetical protein
MFLLSYDFPFKSKVAKEPFFCHHFLKDILLPPLGTVGLCETGKGTKI